MTRFADDLSAELSVLVRARVPMHGIRLTVRERIVERLGRGPLGAREVSESVERQYALPAGSPLRWTLRTTLSIPSAGRLSKRFEAREGTARAGSHTR